MGRGVGAEARLELNEGSAGEEMKLRGPDFEFQKQMKGERGPYKIEVLGTIF